MSSIPPNIFGSIIQTQVSAAETARNEEAQRNKKARDSRALAKLADQHESEVENTDQTEEVIVRRQDERQRNGQDAADTYDAHEENQNPNLYNADGKTESSEEKPPDTKNKDDHIDLSA